MVHALRFSVWKGKKCANPCIKTLWTGQGMRLLYILRVLSLWCLRCCIVLWRSHPLQCSPGWVRTQMGTYAATRTADKGTILGYYRLYCSSGDFLIMINIDDSIIVCRFTQKALVSVPTTSWLILTLIQCLISCQVISKINGNDWMIFF